MECKQALDGRYAAAGPVSDTEEEQRQVSEQCEQKAKTVWSFCCFLHFVTTEGRRNPTSERS